MRRRPKVIVHSIEINRTPADVFAYLDDLERHGEWQTSIIEAHRETEGPTGVGTRAREKRKVGRTMEFVYEITEHDPPKRSSFRGLNGPVRPVGTVTVEPVGDGSSSRVTIEFTLEGHGLGKLIAPLANRDAKRTIPQDQERLKERLEAGA
jgi:uncharacterized membrane protein